MTAGMHRWSKRLGYEIDIYFLFGSAHNWKNVNLQLEVPFKLVVDGKGA